MKEIDAILELASLVSKSENVGNKVTSVSASSTDVQYPSAKAVYSAIFGNAETWTFTLADGTTVTKKVAILP